METRRKLETHIRRQMRAHVKTNVPPTRAARISGTDKTIANAFCIDLVMENQNRTRGNALRKKQVYQIAKLHLHRLNVIY